MASTEDLRFMRLAIEQARKGKQTPGGAEVGAVLVRKNGMVCAGFNESEMRHDPTAHAEMVVIRRLCAELQTGSLAGCTLYCTLQPCGMCTMACLWAGISRIVYGAGRDNVHSVYFETRHQNTFDFIRDAFRDDLEMEGGVLSEECAVFYAAPQDPVSQQNDPAHGRTDPPRSPTTPPLVKPPGSQTKKRVKSPQAGTKGSGQEKRAAGTSDLDGTSCPKRRTGHRGVLPYNGKTEMS